MNNWIPLHINTQNLINEIMDIVPEPMMITDPQGRLLHTNDYFENMVQKSSDELIGKYYGEALDCKFYMRNPEQCGGTYYCEICEIRKIFEAQQHDDDKAMLRDGQIIVRELVTNNTPLTKIFKVSVKSIDFKEGKILICLFSTLKQQELEEETE